MGYFAMVVSIFSFLGSVDAQALDDIIYPEHFSCPQSEPSMDGGMKQPANETDEKVK